MSGVNGGVSRTRDSWNGISGGQVRTGVMAGTRYQVKAGQVMDKVRYQVNK